MELVMTFRGWDIFKSNIGKYQVNNPDLPFTQHGKNSDYINFNSLREAREYIREQDNK